MTAGHSASRTPKQISVESKRAISFEINRETKTISFYINNPMGKSMRTH